MDYEGVSYVLKWTAMSRRFRYCVMDWSRGQFIEEVFGEDKPRLNLGDRSLL